MLYRKCDDAQAERNRELGQCLWRSRHLHLGLNGSNEGAAGSTKFLASHHALPSHASPLSDRPHPLATGKDIQEVMRLGAPTKKFHPTASSFDVMSATPELGDSTD